ncbi:hypothetical protein OC845_002325 [Tilletia horrida]|nr:hypothetical protein OC845_002325 [Tilletia horrida]
MGASSSREAPPPPLAAITPLGLYPRFTIHTGQMALSVRRKFGGDCSVKDAMTGQKIFDVLSSAFSFSNKREILDAQGQFIMWMETRPFTMYPKIDAFDGRRRQSGTGVAPPVLKVKFGTSTSANVMFKDRCRSDGVEQDVVLRLETNYRCSKATVFDAHGQPIARMLASSAGHEMLLTIAPGADAALATAICTIVMDRARAKQRRNRNPGMMGGGASASASANAGSIM